MRLFLSTYIHKIDKKGRVSLPSTYRTIINENNSFWKANKSYASIMGKFVEDCMWTPKMAFLNVNEMKNHNPTPTSANGSPLEFFILKNGTMSSYLRNAKITFSCGMDFSHFPFDIQVMRGNLGIQVM